MTAPLQWQKAKNWKDQAGQRYEAHGIADASVLPVALYTDSAHPHEVKLVQATLDEIVTVRRPRRIIRDRAHDSDPLNEALAGQGIGLVTQH